MTWLSSFVQGVGDVGADIVNTASTLSIGKAVLPPSAYSSQGAAAAGAKVSGIANTVLTDAANVVVPGSGALINAEHSIVGSILPSQSTGSQVVQPSSVVTTSIPSGSTGGAVVPVSGSISTNGFMSIVTQYWWALLILLYLLTRKGKK